MDKGADAFDQNHCTFQIQATCTGASFIHLFAQPQVGQVLHGDAVSLYFIVLEAAGHYV